MATQLKHTDFQHAPYPAARPSLRVVFDTTTATQAVASAIGQLPPATRDATLEELAIGSAAEALIATARHLLSPHVYAAFLQWGAISARFSGPYTDDEGSALLSTLRTSLELAAGAVPLTSDDLAFKSYLMALEAADGPAFGPLEVSDSANDFVNLLIRGVQPDLDSASPVVAGINSLARQATAVSSTTTAWSTQVADAIAQAFDSVQQMPADVSSTELFTRDEVERIPTRFHRGLLIHWQRAFDAYVQAKADAATATGEDDPENDLGAAESYALHRLMLISAPSPAALAIKARIYEEAECWELNAANDIARVFASDTRRFAKVGPFVETDKPLLAAFATTQRIVAELDAMPNELAASIEDGLYAVLDPATMVLLEHRATTVEGAIVKLRRAFMDLVAETWAGDAITDPKSDRFTQGLAMADLCQRMVWSAIEDLSRVGGVSLTEEAA